jgi:hypothetical protein
MKTATVVARPRLTRLHTRSAPRIQPEQNKKKSARGGAPEDSQGKAVGEVVEEVSQHQQDDFDVGLRF